MAKEIPLTKGFVAIVDDEDYERMARYRWHVSSNPQYPYAQRADAATKKIALMHREVMAVLPGIYVDHIDGNPLNNQKANLRVCTKAENHRNHKVQKNNACGYSGVYLHKRKQRWMASIWINSKRINLGGFDTAEDAAMAYNEAATKYFGEFARLNVIQDRVS